MEFGFSYAIPDPAINGSIRYSTQTKSVSFGNSSVLSIFEREHLPIFMNYSPGGNSFKIIKTLGYSRNELEYDLKGDLSRLALNSKMGHYRGDLFYGISKTTSTKRNTTNLIQNNTQSLRLKSFTLQFTARKEPNYLCQHKTKTLLISILRHVTLYPHPK